MPPRGIRNNNPGNIRAVSRTTWVGQQGVDDAGFVIFDKPENGIRALAKVLRNYQSRYGLSTVGEVIFRWAPPIENDTHAYVQDVCKQLGVKEDEWIALTNPSLLLGITSAIIRHENGMQPYGIEQLTTGVRSAMT